MHKASQNIREGGRESQENPQRHGTLRKIFLIKGYQHRNKDGIVTKKGRKIGGERERHLLSNNFTNINRPAIHATKEINLNRRGHNKDKRAWGAQLRLGA